MHGTSRLGLAALTPALMTALLGASTGAANERSEFRGEGRSEFRGEGYVVWRDATGPLLGDIAKDDWKTPPGLVKEMPGVASCRYRIERVQTLNQDENTLHLTAYNASGFRMFHGKTIVLFSGDRIKAINGRLGGCGVRPLSPVEFSNLRDLGDDERNVLYDDERDEYVLPIIERHRRSHFSLASLTLQPESMTGDGASTLARMSHLSFSNSSLDSSSTGVTTGWKPRVKTTSSEPCRATLEQTSPTRGLKRVQDGTGGEIQKYHVCRLQPTFSVSTAANSFEETNTYFYAYRARRWAVNEVWAAFAPSKTTDLAIEVNNTGNHCGTGTSACFHDFGGPHIAFEDGASRSAALIAHEYGHYVIWTYGDLSNACFEGSDEGDSLDENLAGLFSAITNWDHQPNLRYDAAMVNGVRSKHLGSNYLEYDPDCDAYSTHRYGQFFREAIWEFMWNRDCTVSTCTGPMAWSTLPGNNNGFSSAAQAREKTTEAMAYALAVTTSSTSYSAIKTLMYIKLYSTMGSFAAGRFFNIVGHHGL